MSETFMYRVKPFLRDRSFAISSLILLVAAIGIQTTARTMQLHFRKLPVPLKKDLELFDANRLWPYQLHKSHRLSSDIEDELGTKDYLQMVLEDAEVEDSNHFGRFINFFVTYYTGDPDQVPHVPDVCYLGGGFDPGGAENTSITIPGLGLRDDQLPVRILSFQNTRGLMPVTQTVIYFFSVNGHYAAERTSVRLHLADIRLKYAYFSKVEISFVSQNPPPRDEVIALAEKFLNRALPVLVEDHWADWDEYKGR